MIVGLTGGIATGKTTVAAMLRKAGARIIDADRISHKVVAPGKPAWKQILAVFGKQVLQADNTIDRKRLGAVVFNDSGLRRQLENIIHPLVYAQINTEVEHYRRTDPQTLIVQDIPLMMETGAHARFTEVILVYIPPEAQLRRLMQRDAISEAEARSRIDAQMPIDAKRDLATIIIDNSGSLAETQAQVTKVYRRLVLNSISTK